MEKHGEYHFIQVTKPNVCVSVICIKNMSPCSVTAPMFNLTLFIKEPLTKVEFERHSALKKCHKRQKSQKSLKNTPN